MKLVWVLRLGFAGLIVGGLLSSCGDSFHTRDPRLSSSQQPYSGRPGYFTPSPAVSTEVREVLPMVHVSASNVGYNRISPASMCFQTRGILHSKSILTVDNQPCPSDGSTISKPKHQFKIVELKSARVRYIRQPIPQWEIRAGLLPIGRLVSQKVLIDSGDYRVQFWLSDFCTGHYEKACTGMSL